MARLNCFLFLLLLTTGCGQSTMPAAKPTASAMHSPNGDADEEATIAPPKHATVKVFINNHKFGDHNGSTTTFSPQPRSQTSKIIYGATCGHSGAVSKLTWEYSGTDEAGDHYRFQRIFPYDQPNQETTTKEVAYTGQELLLFEDDVQRIGMRPASAISESK